MSNPIIPPDPGDGDRYVPNYEEQIAWVWDAPQRWPLCRDVEYLVRESGETQARRKTDPMHRQLRFLSAELRRQNDWVDPPGLVAKRVNRLVETGIVPKQRDAFWRVLDEVTARGRALLATDVTRFIRAATGRCTDQPTAEEWEQFRRKAAGAKLLTAVHPNTPLPQAHGIGSKDGKQHSGSAGGRPPDYSRQEILQVVEWRTELSTYDKDDQRNRHESGLAFRSMGRDVIARLTGLNRSKVGRILNRTVYLDGAECRLWELDTKQSKRALELLRNNPPKWFLELPCV